MLVLTRRENESIVIGQEIVVTVLGVKGNKVRLGISAPPDIAVHREEVRKRLEAEVPTEPPTHDEAPSLTICP